MKVIYLLIAALISVLVVYRAPIIAFFAKVRFVQGNTKAAVKAFELAQKLGKLSPAKLLEFGYLLMRQGDFSGAKKVLEKAELAAKKPAEKRQIESILALAVWKDGDLDGAIRILENVLDSFRQTTVYQNLGLMYILGGNAEKALAFNKEAVDYNSDDLIIQDNLAQSYVLCGDVDSAEQVYTKLMEKKPTFPEAYYGYGFLLIDKGEVDKGKELVEKSLDMRYSALSVMQREDVEKLLEEKLK